MKQICVVGTGYVGLVTGTCLADLGNRVICLDIDEAKIARLQGGELTIYEPGLEELVARNVASGRLSFTTSYAEAVPDADFCFIAVNTPSGTEGEADLGQVRAAAAALAAHLKDGAIVINKSTVPIGTADRVDQIISRHLPPGREHVHIGVVSNPEFLREGSAVADFMRPDRVVLGATRRSDAEYVATLYISLQAPILITDPRTAEMIKYAANCMLATKISFINAMAEVAEVSGADAATVSDMITPKAQFTQTFFANQDEMIASSWRVKQMAEIFANQAKLFSLLSSNSEGIARPMEAIISCTEMMVQKIDLLRDAVKQKTEADLILKQGTPTVAAAETQDLVDAQHHSNNAGLELFQAACSRDAGKIQTLLSASVQSYIN